MTVGRAISEVLPFAVGVAISGWRTWLSTHNTAMMAVLFLVFGVVLFSQGLRGLT